MQPYTNILVDFYVIGQKGMDFLSFFLMEEALSWIMG